MRPTAPARSRRLRRWTLLLLLVALGAAPASALARFAQEHPWETCPLPAGATLKAEEDPVVTGTPVVVRGSGWNPGSTVGLMVNGASYFQAPYAPRADAKGNFALTFTADRSPGKMLVSTSCAGVHVMVWITVVPPPTVLPHVQPCTGSPLLRPSSYVVACADRSAVLKRIRWQSWTESEARGSATYVVKRTSYAATVALSAVQIDAHGPLFTKLTIRYVARGKSRTVARVLPTA